MDDARIAVGLPTHPKTKKLIKRLGQAAAWNLVCLILWAAANRSDGRLTNMSVEDIESAADWMGDDGEFVAALVGVRFLDAEGEGYVLHDWHEHNPWAAGADARSAKARWNAAKRHHGHAEADRLVPEYAAIRNAASNASSTDSAQGQQEYSNAPSPSPSPNTFSDNGVWSAGADPAPDLKSLPLPKGWQLPMGWGEWALAEFPHWTAETVRHEARQFVDHYSTKSGKDARSADWLASWRKWCRSEIAQRAHPKPSGDVARSTVPSRQGPDPALQQIKADEHRAVPIPPEIRQRIAALKAGAAA